uniref:Uncharacterized protein n=1 Tax=Arundo donax TaxID=35708 RepID=A0A0A8Z307_ARUDO
MLVHSVLTLSVILVQNISLEEIQFLSKKEYKRSEKLQVHIFHLVLLQQNASSPGIVQALYHLQS